MLLLIFSKLGRIAFRRVRSILQRTLEIPHFLLLFLNNEPRDREILFHIVPSIVAHFFIGIAFRFRKFLLK